MKKTVNKFTENTQQNAKTEHITLLKNAQLMSKVDSSSNEANINEKKLTVDTQEGKLLKTIPKKNVAIEIKETDKKVLEKIKEREER